ncbi:MAG: NFYB/HAP3 family transcription factor subunit [Nanoarchaeota archaeon]|nr:NFYB/HAP3 family transcription factor subunit [Nanoarchaeota archaeon]
MTQLPIAAVERIARKAGVERISAEALRELTVSVEDISAELVREIETIAKHARRRTVKPEDIRIAAGKA